MMLEAQCKPSFAIQKPRQKKVNIRVLTQIREKFQTSKPIISEYKIGNTVIQRKKKRELTKISSPKNTVGSEKSIGRKDGGFIFQSEELDSITLSQIKIVQQQILMSITSGVLPKQSPIISIINEIFQIEENINENFYDYKIIEKNIKAMNQTILKLKTCSLRYYGYCVSALLFYEYGSHSLSLFYFDKALKTLQMYKNQKFDTNLQLAIFKTVAKIFLNIGQVSDAKDMAYMFLRKSWKWGNKEEEMNAYDLIGLIELEDGNIEMSRYFHRRMCSGKRERQEILIMSNNELKKNERELVELTVYENIMVFVKRQRPIISILINHYRSEAEQGQPQKSEVKQQLMYTHRSSNRVLRIHRKIQRKMIDEKQSKQLHFIRPRDIKKMRKIVTQFSSFLFELRRNSQNNPALKLYLTKSP